jgi:CRP/FNR family cyclic AMP-dependent transcriptional regulator
MFVNGLPMAVSQETDFGTVQARLQPVCLLDIAPDLARGIDDGAREAARDVLVVRTLDFDSGHWQPPPKEGLLGFLVLDGFLVRYADIGSTNAAELRGPGDLLRPWDDDTDDGLIPVSSRLTALTSGRLAELDTRFLESAAQFPALLRALAARMTHRTRCATILAAIGHMKRVEDRLVVFFGLLGGEWGRVSPDGIVLPMPMSHALIADFVGAERPSVTTSLGRLRESGLVTRRPDRTWVLGHDIGKAANERVLRDQLDHARELPAESRALSVQAKQAISRSRAAVDRHRANNP